MEGELFTSCRTFFPPFFVFGARHPAAHHTCFLFRVVVAVVVVAIAGVVLKKVFVGRLTLHMQICPIHQPSIAILFCDLPTNQRGWTRGLFHFTLFFPFSFLLPRLFDPSRYDVEVSIISATDCKSVFECSKAFLLHCWL